MNTDSKALITIFLIIFVALSLAVTASANDHKMARQEVLTTFQEYIALNDDFVSSVNTGKAKTGKTYKDLRKEAEDYADGPFHTALSSAEEITCDKGDKEILSSLFKVIISTSNSADESPSWTLGGIYVCQPSLVEKEMARLKPAERKQIYDTLEFGFENVATTKPKDDKRILELRKRIAALARSRENNNRVHIDSPKSGE